MYVLSTGCQWRALPKDLPPKSTVHDYFMGLRRIEWVILGVEDSTNLGIARGFCILAGLYLASMMDGTSIETPSAAVGYVFVSGFSAGADSTRDFR
jgi:transposase